MPGHRSPYPPLELDFEEISAVRLPVAPVGEETDEDSAPASQEVSTQSSTSRLTAAPDFDLEAFARDAMAGNARQEPPESGAIPAEPEGRSVSDMARTAPPPIHERRPATSEPRVKSPLVHEMNAYLDASDFKAALVIADQILAEDPGNPWAKQGSLRCQAALEELYIRRLGPLSQVPTLGVSQRELLSLALDHRAGFILAQVDGICTLDMILDMSSMRRLDTLRVLLELVQQGILQLS